MQRLIAAMPIAVLLFAACASEPGQQRAEFSFEDTALGSPPPGWQVAETNGVGNLASWAVVEAGLGESGQRILSLEETRNRRQTYNLMLLPNIYPADLTVGVRVRAESGVEDQGGGLVWRAVDEQNYYIARWNPLEDNLRAYKVVDGRRTQLLTADVAADPDSWHGLVVSMTGERMEVRIDGEILLSGEDSTFPSGGRVGVWTKADAATSFDDLEVEWGK